MCITWECMQFDVYSKQNGDLFASTLLFLSCEQLRLAGEEVSNTPPCFVEHCFACCMQDVLVANVTAVRPFVPSKVFVKTTTSGVQLQRYIGYFCMHFFRLTTYTIQLFVRLFRQNGCSLCTQVLSKTLHKDGQCACVLLSYTRMTPVATDPRNGIVSMSGVCNWLVYRGVRMLS